MSSTDELDRLSRLVADRPAPLAALRVAARRAHARRRRVRVALAAAGSALVVAAGGVVLGGGPLDRADTPYTTDPAGHSAHTGDQPSDAEDVRLGGPGEQLDPTGDDFLAVVREVTTDIPFPTEEARTVSAQLQYDDLHDQRGTRVSTGALRGFVANDAICSWANAWVDPERRGAATQALQGATSWPAVTDLDQRFAGESRFWWLPDAQAAALGTDEQALGKALARNVRCAPALVPDLPWALPRALRP